MKHTTNLAAAMLARAQAEARRPERRRRIAEALGKTLPVAAPIPLRDPYAAAALEGVADGFRAMAEHIDFLAAQARSGPECGQ